MGKHYPGPDKGSNLPGPLRSHVRLPGKTRDSVDEVFSACAEAVVDFQDDFLGGAINTTDGAWKLRDTSVAGAPTIGLKANEHVLQVILANTAEAEVAGVDFGDQRNFPADKRPRAKFRFQVVTAPAAGERLFIGLVSAYNAVFSSIATRIGFRLSASLDLLVEADDGVVDSGLVNTGFDVVLGKWYWGEFTVEENGHILFYLDGAEVGRLTTVVAFDGTALQPAIYVQKDAGAGQPALEVDYYRARCNRE